MTRRQPSPPNVLDGYRLNEPDRRIKLPKRLREVSGLVALSATEVACIQDEDGIIFVFSLAEERITREIRFGAGGDYEGLTRVGDTYFVLRSDGSVFEVTDREGSAEVRVRALDLPTRDNEGICADPARHRLLIAPKSRPEEDDIPKRSRPIFGFDLPARKLLPEPVVLLRPQALSEFALLLAGGGAGTGKKHKRPVKHFRPSSLAVHPVSGQLFVISAVDRVLGVFDWAGRVVGYAALDPKRFRQPEGITFLEGGDLLITNEGAGKKAILLRFSWRDAGQ